MHLLSGKVYMPQITYVEHDGTSHQTEVPVGRSLMEGARDNNIPGIEADCGGAGACSTCHVYVSADWVDRLPSMDNMERDMIDFAFEPDEIRSRLTCQVTVVEALDGLVVYLPAQQG